MPTTTGANPLASSEGTGEEKPKLRPCCACPETKKARDECIIEEEKPIVLT